MAKYRKYQEKFLIYCQTESVKILKERYNADTFCIFDSRAQIRPLFFRGISTVNGNNQYLNRKMYCPMDMLVELISSDKKQRATKNTKTISMMDFLVEQPSESMNKRQLERIREAINEVLKSPVLDAQHGLFSDYAESLKKLHINQATVHHALKLAYSDKTNSKFTYKGNHKKYWIKMLYSIAPDIVISCFRKAV